MSALTAFRAARDSGQPGPAVHYNIAVCEFELGRYVAAERSFAHISVTFPKMRPLAEYNRGLALYRQNLPHAAREHFLRAYQLGKGDEKLRTLSSNMLRQIEPNEPPRDLLSGAFGVSMGFDDNIVLLDELALPADTAAESGFVDVFAALRAPITGLPGLHFDANAYVLSYFDNDDFNQGELGAGTSYDLSASAWRMRIGIGLARSTFGGDALQDSANLELRLTRGIAKNSTLRIRYRYSDISAADSQFSAIEGTRERLEFRYRWRFESRRFDIAAYFEDNDRDDPGVSANRTRLRLSYLFQVSAKWNAEVEGDFRVSRYSDLSPQRTEDLITLGLRAHREFASGWRFTSQLQHSRNSSTDDRFSYDRNQISIGALKPF